MKHRTLRLSPYRLQLTTKILFAGVALALGNFLLAGMCMLFPTVAQGKGFITGLLLTGSGPVDLTTEEGQKKLVATITEKMEALAKKAADGRISEEQLNKAVTELNTKIAKLTDESLKELKKQADELAAKNENLVAEIKKANDALIAQSTEIKKLQDGNANKKENEVPVTFREALKEAFHNMANKDQYMKEVSDGGDKRLSLKAWFENMGQKATLPPIQIKAATDMFQSNIVQNYVNYLRLTELDSQRVSVPLTIYPHVMNVFTVRPISRPNMALLVVYSYEDGTGYKAEGGAPGKSSFLLKTVSFPALVIATYFNLSDETLDDLDEVMAEIEAVAPDKLQDKIDTIILGTGGDDAASIKGIRHADKSTPYASVFGATIDAPYIVDVIADAKLQCENAKYRPNVVYLNPTDFAKLAAKKNNLEDSMTDKRVAYNGMGEAVSVCGLLVIKSTALDANQMLVLDNRQPVIGNRKSMTMEIGYNGTDFVEGQRTVKLGIRIAFGVRDKAGIIYVSDIDAAAVALTKP